MTVRWPASASEEGRVTYLDHAATTPVLPEVLAAMTEQLGRVGNASSLHASGRAARRAAEQSRERLAEALGARPSEVLFTGGGTESDNLAVKGAWLARRAKDPALDGIVTSGIEHHAVLDPVEYLAEARGVRVTWLEPDRCGHIAVDSLRQALETGGVAVVSVMWANNEVGTVQPVAELAEENAGDVLVEGETWGKLHQHRTSLGAESGCFSQKAVQIGFESN